MDWGGHRGVERRADQTGLQERTRRSMRSHKPQTLSTSHGLRSLFGAELYKDVLDVGFNSLGSDGEVACDFFVGQALGNQVENGTFTGAERVREPRCGTGLGSRLIT